jgi:transcriptional regulator with XRE-family HTH domain
MKPHREMFTSSKVLGARLREMRKRTGMTAEAVASAMGRLGKGRHNVVLRLERGDAKYPSLALVADYLRACRARISDIADIIDSYTAGPRAGVVAATEAVAEATRPLPASEQGSVKAHVLKQVLVRERTVPRPEQVQRRVERLLGRSVQKQVFEQALYDLLKEAGDRLTPMGRKTVGEHGRTWFGLLLHRKTPAPRQQGKFAALRRQAEEFSVDKEWLDRAEQVARAVRDGLAAAGMLDPQAIAQSDACAGARPFRVGRAEARIEQEQMDAEFERGRKTTLVLSMVRGAIEDLLERRHMDFPVRRKWRTWAGELFDVLVATRERMEERRTRIEELVAKSGEPELARELLKPALEAFDKWKKRLPEER